MAIALLATLPPPPLPTDPEEIFDTKAGATLVAQKMFVDEMNTSTIPGINAAIGDAEGSSLAASNSAAAAAASVVSATAIEASVTGKLAQTEGFANNASASELAANVSASAAAASELAAITSAGEADASKVAAAASVVSAEAARDLAQYWAGQAEEAVVGDLIVDTEISNIKVRSSLNDSIGNFENIDVSASSTITTLQFARITQTASSVTVTLPAAPSEGQMVMVGNLTNRVDHIVDVGTNKVKGKDAAGSLVIDRAYTTITLKYINAAYGWEVLQ